jgi:hypothetical protein
MTFAMIHLNTRQIGFRTSFIFKNDGNEMIGYMFKSAKPKHPWMPRQALEYFTTKHLKPNDETTLHPHNKGFFCGSFAYGMACSCFR